MPAFDMTQPDQTFEHKLGTEDVLVAVWQNKFGVSADVSVVDENNVRVFVINANEDIPTRVIVVPAELSSQEPVEEKKKVRRKSSASKETTKRRRKSDSEDS